MRVSLFSRLSIFLMESIGSLLWGFRPRLMREIVLRLGAFGSLIWFVKNMPRYESTLKHFGPLKTHLSALSVSLANSCGYCTFGHAFAFNLHYYRIHGRLFELDESQLANMAVQEGDNWPQVLRSALERADLSEEVDHIAKLYALMAGDPAMNRDEERSKHLATMFATLNYCGVDSKARPDEAHSPINKNRELKARYAASRAELAAGREESRK